MKFRTFTAFGLLGIFALLSVASSSIGPSARAEVEFDSFQVSDAGTSLQLRARAPCDVRTFLTVENRTPVSGPLNANFFVAESDVQVVALEGVDEENEFGFPTAAVAIQEQLCANEGEILIGVELGVETSESFDLAFILHAEGPVTDPSFFCLPAECEEISREFDADSETLSENISLEILTP